MTKINPIILNNILFNSRNVVTTDGEIETAIVLAGILFLIIIITLIIYYVFDF